MIVDIPVPDDHAYLVMVVLNPLTGRYLSRIVLPEFVRDAPEAAQGALREMVDGVVA